MPRGQKSKLRAQERRRQARGESRCLPDAQAPGGQEEESPSCSSEPGDASPSSSNAGLPQVAKGAPPTAAIAGAPSRKRSGKGAKGKKRQKATSSPESLEKGLLRKKAGILIHYMLYMHKTEAPMSKGDMLKMVHKRFREQFPEILTTATDQVELLFGLELKKIKPRGGAYTFVNKSDDSNGGNPISGLGFPTNGLLLPLLGLIFLNGNSVSEEEMWEFLSVLDLYDGKEHLIFGEPRKLITQDLVKLEYLVYRQVPYTDPPRYEFLWGPRAHAETSKMKVLKFLAKVNESTPSSFPQQYEEALREEKEGAQAKASASHGPTSLFD